MIALGEKTEEYRIIKRYWRQRLTEEDFTSFYIKNMHRLGKMVEHPFELKDYTIRFKDYDSVRFYLGYTKKYCEFRIESISIGLGKSEWGAPKDTEVFIIKLGIML